MKVKHKVGTYLHTMSDIWRHFFISNVNKVRELFAANINDFANFCCFYNKKCNTK